MPEPDLVEHDLRVTEAASKRVLQIGAAPRAAAAPPQVFTKLILMFGVAAVPLVRRAAIGAVRPERKDARALEHPFRRLAAVPGVVVLFLYFLVDDESLATNRASEAIAEGRKLGADYVLYGSFTRFGEGAHPRLLQ